MIELNREQIIKALEDWKYNLCVGCEKDNCDTCVAQMLGQSLSLIKELTEENERLRADNAKYEAENHAEFNKWLKLEEATKRHHSELFEEAKIAVKEETVRKMKGRLKRELLQYDDYDELYVKTVRDCIEYVAQDLIKEPN